MKKKLEYGGGAAMALALVAGLAIPQPGVFIVLGLVGAAAFVGGVLWDVCS